MKITDIKAYSVAVPFTAPIQSAFGVSYPARMRTLIKVFTDEGIVGLGECGYSPLATFTGTPQAQAFEGPIKKLVLGQDPFDSNWIRRLMRYSNEESIALEIACWDIMGKACGQPVYRMLGGEGYKKSVEHSAYIFFRAPDPQGKNAVTPANLNDHVLEHIREYGFRTIKVKLGANPPMEEARTIMRLREEVGPDVQILLDPNGSWILGTAMTVAKMLEPYNILYYEDPIRYDENNIRRLQQATSTPICVSSDDPESLRRVLVTNTADVVQCDLYASGGIRGTQYWYSIARAFEKPTAMHSGREIGVAQIAKIHLVAAQPDIVYPMDAMYHQYVDDVLKGGKLKYQNGCIDVPQTPGLGIDLDDEKLAKLELTDQVHRFYDEFWAETKRNLGIGAPFGDNTVRRF